MTLLYDVVFARRSFVRRLTVAPLEELRHMELSHMEASLGCFEHAKLCVEFFYAPYAFFHSFIHLVVVSACHLCKRNPLLKKI